MMVELVGENKCVCACMCMRAGMGKVDCGGSVFM